MRIFQQLYQSPTRLLVLLASASALAACSSSTDVVGSRSVKLTGPSGERTVEMWRGVTVPLTAKALDAKGQLVTDAVFTFTAKNANIASVDGAGRVTGVSVGTTFVLVRTSNGNVALTDSVQVTVSTPL